MAYDFDPPQFMCVNCGKSISWKRRIKLFCSDLCKDEAKYVRYYRRCQNDGRISRPDIQEALQIRKAHLISGGYPYKERILTKEIRSTIIARDKGLCQICRKPGSEIDHIEGSSNELSNLQLLCHKCHLEKTMAKIKSIDSTDPEYLNKVGKHVELDLRTHYSEPLRECDDPELWNRRSREIVQKRKEEYSSYIKTILDKIQNEGLSLRKMAIYLNDLKIPTYSGYGKWYRKMISYIMREEI
jgi:5-methylcytosine-specific restriction endonuclease McrA